MTNSQTCSYVADVPASRDSDEYDHLGRTQWHCPHPPLKQHYGGGEYCVFHTDIEVPVRYRQYELKKALDDAGNSPRDTRPEHRGEFVGATFEAVDFSDKTIRTSVDYSIRFDNAQFLAKKDELLFEVTNFEAIGQQSISFNGAEFIADEYDAKFTAMSFRNYGDGHIDFRNTTFKSDGRGEIDFWAAKLTNGDFRNADFGETNLREVELTGADLRGANVKDVSVSGSTTCKRLYEPQKPDIPEWSKDSNARVHAARWSGTAQTYHDLKTVFSNHGLVSKARSMYLQERRARRLEIKVANGRFNPQYLGSRLSQIFTGYGVQIQNLVFWMLTLFIFSTVMYVNTGVRDTLMANISYSVLAFTVAPPEVPEGVWMQFMMMIETFFGTLSTVLLGYILGNRERF